MKLLTSMIILAATSVGAEVWQRPPYLPDENHLPPLVREAQQEVPRPAKENRLRKKKKLERLRKQKSSAD